MGCGIASGCAACLAGTCRAALCPAGSVFSRCGRMQRSSAARGNAGRSTAIFCPSAAVPAHKRETNSSAKNSFVRISLSPFQNLILLL